MFMTKKILTTLWLATIFCLSSAGAAQGDSLQSTLSKNAKASFVLMNDQGKVITQHLSEKRRIPASTMKLVTAWLALEHWGRDHHFTTDLYLDDDNWLWVKGFGDPYLISEEIDLLSIQLAPLLGKKHIKGIGIDTSHFDALIASDSPSYGSSQPYDAPLSAVSINFNTINVLKNSDLDIQSAEAQTPLTYTSLSLAKPLKNGKHRINVATSENAVSHFAGVLAVKLRKQKSNVGIGIKHETLPANAQKLMVYENTHRLHDVVESMLLYSNNMIANQLFLMLGADITGQPANWVDARLHANKHMREQFAWKDFLLYDGAGLSRENSLSAVHLVELLDKFVAYDDLLPKDKEHTKLVRAKTGTLWGVTSYAGYLKTRKGSFPFAIVLNDHNLKSDTRYELISEWVYKYTNKKKEVEWINGKDSQQAKKLP